MNTQQFAATVKAKYPQYAGIDDATLTQKILAKYPQYQSQVNTTGNTESGNEGFFGRVANDYKKAAADITGGIQKGADALQQNDGSLGSEFKTAGSLLRTGLRTAGGVAEASFSPITEAPVVKQTLSGVASLINKIPGVSELIQNADSLSKQHPELAKDISNIVNLATLGSSAPATEGTFGSKIIENAGKVVQENASAASESQLRDFTRKLLTPEQTKAVKESQVGRTSETGTGIFKKSVVAPTPSQVRSEEAILSVPGLNPKATVQQNYNIIRDANTTEAQNLKKQIAENDFIIPRKEVSARLDESAKSLQTSPLIVGDAQKTAEKLLNGAREFINNNPGTGSGLLEARKQFDHWVLEQKPAAFDAKAENAFTLANREIRRSFNDLLDEKATNIDVKKSLSHQSALYNALETLTPKAATEADSAIGRGMQRIGKILGTKNKVVQGVAAGAGIGGLGAAATFAPVVAGVGIPTYLVYRAGKLVLKPEVRKAFGKLLETAGPKLQKTDRAFIQGILNTYTDQEDVK